MFLKGNYHGQQIAPLSLGFHLVYQVAVAAMYAVEEADGCTQSLWL